MYGCMKSFVSKTFKASFEIRVRGGFRVRVGVWNGFRVRVRDRVSVRAKFGWVLCITA